jgi:hypothetical protein
MSAPRREPPPGSQLGGLNGVFTSAVPTSAPLRHAGETPPPPVEDTVLGYQLFRFYSDGLVLSASVYINSGELDATGLQGRWSMLAHWFHREAQTDQLVRGTYYRRDNHLWFVTMLPADRPDPQFQVEYSGTLAADRLILDSHNHFNSYRTSQVEYVRLDVSG